MIVQLSDESVTALGAQNAKECSAKISAVLDENKNLKKNMSEQTSNFDAVIKRLDAIESKMVTTENLNTAVKAAVEDVSAAVKTDAVKDATAAASKTVIDAMAAIGTTPAKPSPAPAATDSTSAIKSLEAAGKYEEAFALLPASEKAQHLGPKSYAAFMRANNRGQVRVR